MASERPQSENSYGEGNDLNWGIKWRDYALELEKRAGMLCDVSIIAELKLERFSFMSFPYNQTTEAIRADLRNSIEAMREILSEEVPDGK